MSTEELSARAHLEDSEDLEFQSFLNLVFFYHDEMRALCTCGREGSGLNDKTISRLRDGGAIEVIRKGGKRGAVFRLTPKAMEALGHKKQPKGYKPHVFRVKPLGSP
jgi:hypothetical protein